MNSNLATKKFRTNRMCSLMVTHACNLNCVYCFEKFKTSKMMTFETAQNILKKEFDDYPKIQTEGSRMGIDFMGGEPLINFDVIKRVYEWTKSLNLPFNIVFSVTTNGTLLDTEKQEWFAQNAKDFRLVMSVDGNEYSQVANRGVSTNTLPLEFIRDTWPNSYFKQTLTHDTLPYYAAGVIALNEHGFRVASSLAQGHTWADDDDKTYREQLKALGQYYIDHPDIPLSTPFDMMYIQLLDENISRPPRKNCGTGTGIHFYDVDGKLYPCHLFLPMVHGNPNVLEEIKDVDFCNDIALIDNDCINCPILRVCATCYGFNYMKRQCVAKRDKSMCKLYLAQAQEISSFQIRYFTSIDRKLTTNELLTLQSAMRCYELVENISM